MSDQEFLTRDEWAIVVTRHLGFSQFEVLNIQTKRLTEGVGFLGEYRFAEVTVRPQDSRKTQVLNFFIKGQPETNQEQKEMVEKTGVFKKEVDVLSKLFVKLWSTLENDGEDMQWSARCYYTRPDVIVFEDMAAKGFHVVNSRIESRWQHCAVVLKSLSNLHAASLIFEEKQPNQPYRVDSEFGDMLRDPFFVNEPGHPGIQWMVTSIAVVCRLVEEVRGADTLRRLKTQIQEELMSLFQLVKTSDRFRNVVSQGDMWRNNIFFREEDGEPVEARMCDYQITRYTPPANDVTCFLYITTSRSFRAQYLSQLLALYHDHLSHNLRRHGVDPEKVLPWEEFKESCEFYKKLGVLIACMYCPVTLINEADYKDVLNSSEEYERFIQKDRLPEVTHALKNDSFYREKIFEVIEEFIEYIENK
ncbi:hypothetical protein R5R35_003003 [Gryllus longicercus]|uniref:CHK kinase-like domain-containing protein n=1 Tax=Gryllus longicercus TaxID=2509291 RepID=A0AAN9VPS3_9ORTH